LIVLATLLKVSDSSFNSFELFLKERTADLFYFLEVIFSRVSNSLTICKVIFLAKKCSLYAASNKNPKVKPIQVPTNLQKVWEIILFEVVLAFSVPSSLVKKNKKFKGD
jgi:hypothetical protein